MKCSTTFIVTGLVLLFLALLYAIAPTFILYIYSGVTCAHTRNIFLNPDIFVWNYWLCHLAGIGCLAVGVRELWKEK